MIDTWIFAVTIIASCVGFSFAIAYLDKVSKELHDALKDAETTIGLL